MSVCCDVVCVVYYVVLGIVIVVICCCCVCSNCGDLLAYRKGMVVWRLGWPNGGYGEDVVLGVYSVVPCGCYCVICACCEDCILGRLLEMICGD